MENGKEYFSTLELLAQPWFPIKSHLTLRKLIESGEVEAIDVSTNPKYRRYRIRKLSVDEYMARKTGVIPSAVDTKKKVATKKVTKTTTKKVTKKTTTKKK